MSLMAELQDRLQSQEFYELMQAYRHSPLCSDEPAIAFERVKTFILTGRWHEETP